jgi:hypothetical protein
MTKNKYSFEKRQKELARRKKKEDKRLHKDIARRGESETGTSSPAIDTQPND